MTPSALKEQKYHTRGLSKSNVTILLCLIIFIAAFLRLYYLPEPSFSSDDIRSIEKGEKVSIGNIVKAVKRGHPSISFIILHYWTQIAGRSEFALRLPAAIFGILSVFALFKLASLIFDNKTALIGALLLAVNPEHFFCSFALKQYTLTLLLALTSLYLLLMTLRGRRIVFWIAFVICNVVLLFTHKSAIFVILTEIVYIAIVYRKYKYSWQIFLSIGVIFLILIALFFLQKRYLQIFSAPRWIAMPTLETFLNVLSSFIAGLSFRKIQGLDVDVLPLPAKIGIFAFFSFFLLLGIFKYFWRQITSDEPQPLIKSGASDGYKSLIYTWATIPILSAYAISFLFWPTFGPTRYHLFWSCSILLLIARGIAAIGKLRFIYPVLFIAICTHLFPILTKESTLRGLNWKDIANYLRENISDGETVHFLSFHRSFSRKKLWNAASEGETTQVIPSDVNSLPLRYYYKGDIYIGIERITPFVRGRWAKGTFLIEVGESVLTSRATKRFDINMLYAKLYANKDAKQFYNIKVTHYWNPKRAVNQKSGEVRRLRR
ncbi:MAG TPA: glycosyltransferase family 39 protein [Candidatus Brocadiia bacterium]|nr:glycosyltransferase family 39 protein [Candidatus Brocadiales bacterium]